MYPSLPRCLGLGLVVAFCLTPFVFAPAGAAPEGSQPQNYTGKVVPLAGLVAKLGGRLDADAAPHWLALVTADAKVYPLIKDDGARMFYKDASLLHRPMRLTGRLLPGSQLLQVVQVHSVRNGQLYEVYYWCDVCAIKCFEEKICECCQGPMERREEPVQK